MIPGRSRFSLSPDDRPYFGPDQIRCQGWLYKGRQIIVHGPGERQLRATVVSDKAFRQTSEPGKLGRLMVEYEYAGEEGKMTDLIALEDYSVVRNKDHEWHKTNWLEKA
jgi:hypothetical protein